MTQKFYLHNATTALGGTLPGGTSTDVFDIGVGFPTVTATGASTNRTMDDTIGSSQVSQALTTSATTSIQKNWFRRFLSPALGAQTFPAGSTIAWSLGASESNANSDMFEAGTFYIAQWRPSTGAVISHLIADRVGGETISNEPGTAQSVVTGSFVTLANKTFLDGDIIVAEWWSAQGQAMGTAYTNTVFYDGTTEGSTTNVASYIDFGFDFALSGGAAANPPYRNQMPPLIAQ